jgi:hypothetical protein
MRIINPHAGENQALVGVSTKRRKHLSSWTWSEAGEEASQRYARGEKVQDIAKAFDVRESLVIYAAKVRALKRVKPKPTSECPWCGETFEVKSYKPRFCSPSCYAALRRDDAKRRAAGLPDLGEARS